MKQAAKTKKTPKTVSRKQSRYTLTLCLIFLIGAIAGMAGTFLVRSHNKTVTIWAATNKVKVPDGLVSYLEREHGKDCQAFRSNYAPGTTPMTTFSIIRSVDNRLAEVNYGCDGTLVDGPYQYDLAVKSDGKWKLIDTGTHLRNLNTSKINDRYEGPAALPDCNFLDQNNVPASFETECADTTGSRVVR